MNSQYGIYIKWNSFKLLLDTGHPFKEIILVGSIRLIVNDNGAKFQTVIHSDGDMPNEYSDYQTNYEVLKNRPFVPIDSDGSHMNRGKTAPKGWHFEPQAVCITTATVNGFYNKDKNGTDLGHTTYKMFNSNGEEVIDPALAIKTEVTWNPDYSYEIIGGNLIQASPPANDIFIWVEGPASIPFLQGGVNLKLLASGSSLNTDGRTSKKLLDELDGSPVPNHLVMTIKHPLNFQHTIQMIFDIFKL